MTASDTLMLMLAGVVPTLVSVVAVFMVGLMVWRRNRASALCMFGAAGCLVLALLLPSLITVVLYRSTTPDQHTRVIVASSLASGVMTTFAVLALLAAIIGLARQAPDGSR